MTGFFESLYISRKCILGHPVGFPPDLRVLTMAFFTNLSMRPARAYSTRAKPQIYGSDVLIEEETLPRYQAQDYYPVRIKEVMDRKYQVISKLGFGRSSTVWLAQDITRYVE